jgi:hypothetical protein
MELVLGYLLNASIAILAVFIYGIIMGLIILWGAGFFTKEKK